MTDLKPIFEHLQNAVNEAWREVLDLLHARRMTNQRAPFVRLTICGWAPTLKGRWL